MNRSEPSKMLIFYVKKFFLQIFPPAWKTILARHIPLMCVWVSGYPPAWKTILARHIPLVCVCVRVAILPREKQFLPAIYTWCVCVCEWLFFSADKQHKVAYMWPEGGGASRGNIPKRCTSSSHFLDRLRPYILLYRLSQQSIVLCKEEG